MDFSDSQHIVVSLPEPSDHQHNLKELQILLPVTFCKGLYNLIHKKLRFLGLSYSIDSNVVAHVPYFTAKNRAYRFSVSICSDAIIIFDFD
jgi:hypothetical protein